MRTKRLSSDEQLKLIEQCRKSGLTDAEWCYENNIRIKTFYMWIYRLRKRGVVDLPARIAEPIPDQSDKREIVKLQIASENAGIEPYNQEEIQKRTPYSRNNQEQRIPVMEIEVAGVYMRITNDVNPGMLAEVIRMLR